MSNAKLNFKSPKGDFKWCFITGQGRTNALNGKSEYSVNVVVPIADAKAAVEQLDDFWAQNKPKGAKEPKSMGYKVSEDGQNVTFTFKTQTTFPTGEAKKVRIYNAAGEEISMPADTRVGNGSRGRVAGVAAVYDASAAARGVSLFLDSVQLTKFVPYTNGAGFDAEEDEGGFDGFAQTKLFERDEEV